jgi:hypothetical protein
MALEGNLQDMSLTDLFQVFRMGNKAGVLLLVHGREQGLIYVRNGELIDAVLLRGSDRQIVAHADEAVIRILQWQNADFVFRHTVSVDERPVRIKHGSDWMVLESIRRNGDAFEMYPGEQISAESHIVLTAAPLSSAVKHGLDPEQWRILGLIPECQNVRELSERIGLSVDRTIQHVRVLFAIGLVVDKPLPRANRTRARIESRQPSPATNNPATNNTNSNPSQSLYPSCA